MHPPPPYILRRHGFSEDAPDSDIDSAIALFARKSVFLPTSIVNCACCADNVSGPPDPSGSGRSNSIAIMEGRGILKLAHHGGLRFSEDLSELPLQLQQAR